HFNLFFTLRVEFIMVALDMIVSLILFVLVLRSDSPLARYFVIGSGAVIIVGFSLAICGYFFNWRYVYQGFLTTIVIEIVCFSLGLGDRFRQSERQKVAAEREQRRTQEALNEKLAKLNTAYERFVPHEFLRSIGHNSILDVKLGDGVEREVTVFFSDIRSYTRIAEQMSPQENFQFLNAYLGRVGPIIQTHRGFVNQYYGDGIMALFLKSPEDALQAAIGIHRVLGYYNAEREAKGRQPIEIGIGIHRGPLMMGIIGDALRMDSGVVSDTVNTAARMEGLTKFFACRTLVSEATLKTLAQARSFGQRYLGKVQVKGRQEVLGIYDLFDSDPEEVRKQKLAIKADFEEGLAFYFDRNFAKAAHCFDRVLEIYPDDVPAQRYHAYTLKNLVEGVPPGWTGVEMMMHK
ncbi:MAG: adenylate/guanylate cyclase domain-containing protein, partial [Bacteroidota bacterium]